MTNFSAFDHLLIASLVAMAVLLYKSQRDLVKNDFEHLRGDLANMVAGLQASVKFLASKVGFMASDLYKIKKKLDIEDDE